MCIRDSFQVEEILGYELSGEGEHIYVWLQKQNLNTAYVSEQLAKQLNIPLRNISYAGRKDKHAVTRQWFGLHVPGKIDPDFDQFCLDGATILKTVRHNKKLKTGNLKANLFNIVLRHVENADDIEQRLLDINENGVPNYFGPQRFGNNNSNLSLGQELVAGNTIRNRNKRNLAISALRSWVFNLMVSERIRKNNFNHIIDGDAIMLTGSHSFFVDHGTDSTLSERLASRDISLSSPLWGKGVLGSEREANRFEQSIASQHPTLCQTLEGLGLEQQRRAINLFANNMRWSQEEDKLTLNFELPSGCFATSVLREVINYYEPERTL